MAIERHLILQELVLRPSSEWTPSERGWVVARVAEGVGYWLPGGSARELNVGDGFVVGFNVSTIVRASQLGPLKLQYFTVQPQYLSGLLTMAEWHQLESASENPLTRVLFFTASEPFGQKFARIAAQTPTDGLTMRCALLQLWTGAAANVMGPLSASAGGNGLRERFRQLVGQMPEARLSECSLSGLAAQLHCSERHFSRLFREEFGVTFRARQAEMRLQHARQLLASSDAKIINVAYDSGYRHLGLFNSMFKKRFGTTPSEWRRQNLRKTPPLQSRKNIPKPVARAGIPLALFMLILNFISPAVAQMNSKNATAPVENNVAARFNVQAYAVNSNTLLPTNILSGVFSKYTGTNISLDEIVQAASDLQLEYLNQGYSAMSIAIAPQQITNGIVTMNVFPAVSPQIWVSGSRYVSSGNPAPVSPNLPAAEPALPPAAPATLADTTNAVQLATSPRTVVASPQTTVAAGPEALAQARAALYQKMAELDAGEKDTRIHVVATNAGPRFEVDKYLVMGNSVLSPEAIAQTITNVDGAFGTNASFDGIRAALTELQGAYRERGYVTVSVGLPQQKLTNAVVKVKVTEGRLAAIKVTGNQYFSSNNVMRALPSLHTNMLLNSHILQRELDVANASRDRQIYPVIGPGPEPDTSELTLKVKDCLPLHMRLEVNNQHTPNTPDMRANFSAQYDNLWDLEHQVGLQYSFSFNDYKAGNDYVVSPFDAPLIANYSGYYRLPLSRATSAQEQVDTHPGSFGYNETTHKFNVPPATGRPELTIYASRSTSDTGVQYGPTGILTQTTNTDPAVGTFNGLTITTNSAGQNITLDENIGFKLSAPLPQLGRIVSSMTLGADYKHYEQTSYNTNENKLFILIPDSSAPGGGGFDTINYYDPQNLPVNYSALDYFPFNVGLSGSAPDQWGTTFFNGQANFNVLPMFSETTAQITTTNITTTPTGTTTTNIVHSSEIVHGHSLSGIAYTSKARPNYVTLQFGADRVQTIYKDWSVKFHGDGQWANGPLFSNEQYALGGSASVRGYTDGEFYGDTGWRFTIEPQTPLVNIGMVDGDVPFWIRSSMFMDYGEAYLLAPPPGGASDRARLWGVGWNLTANIGNHLDARLTIAYPLLATALTPVGAVHVYFAVGAQF
jgi:hemolysin activation/secretion protein/AraC-like DNA-binding protein